MQRIPQVWPGWQADELLGQGAFGKVYRASRTLGGHTTQAAIKIIDIPRDEAEIESLRSMGMDALSIRSYFEETARSVINEVATMDRLKGSPHVVHIEGYQLLERESGVGWTVLIRMELLEPLEVYLRSHGLPNAREVAGIGIDMCDALQACHEAGIIHRDVKPANVFRSDYGEYKLGDFGIAKSLEEATRSTKSFAGTDAFMAPEVSTRHYDETVDIYSLGIMLYRWLNGGRPPFIGAAEAPSRAALEDAQARRLAGERPPLPTGAGVPTDLARIVRKACEPYPANRWSSAENLGRALRAWLGGEKVEVGEEESDTTPPRQAPPSTATPPTYYPIDGLNDVGPGNKDYLTVDACMALDGDLSSAKQHWYDYFKGVDWWGSDADALIGSMEGDAFEKVRIALEYAEAELKEAEGLMLGGKDARMVRKGRLVFDAWRRFLAHKNDAGTSRSAAAIREDAHALSRELYAEPANIPDTTPGPDIEVALVVTVGDALAGIARNVDFVVPSTGLTRTVAVRIPAGTRDGSTLRCGGVGDVDRSTGAPGDLLVKVHVVGEGQNPIPPVQPVPKTEPAAQKPPTTAQKPPTTAKSVVVGLLLNLVVLIMFAFPLTLMFGPPAGIALVVLDVVYLVWKGVG